MVDMGFGLSCDNIKVVAYRIVEKCERSHPFHNEMAGRAWLDGFMKGTLISHLELLNLFHTIVLFV